MRAFHSRLVVAGLAALTLGAVAVDRPSARQEAPDGITAPSDHVGPRCFRHPLRIGMTEKQALESDWCYPDRVEESTDAPGAIEYWFYGRRDWRSGAHTGTILFDHGVVTYFSDNNPD
jgi:hypothetical protein